MRIALHLVLIFVIGISEPKPELLRVAEQPPAVRPTMINLFKRV